jgi:PAS domain S-box-containing protein
MIALDIRTVVVLSIANYVICTLFAVQLWRQNRERFAGLGYVAGHFALLSGTMVLIAMRGAISDWLSIVLAQAMLFSAMLLVYTGLLRFVGRTGAQLHNYLLLALAVLGVAYGTFVDPNLRQRNLIISVVVLIFCFQCLWLMWRRVGVAMRPLTFWVGMVFGAYCLVSLGRIIVYFAGYQTGNEYFRSGNFEALVLTAFVMLAILLTYSLVLMVNQRLVMAITAQQQKFASAFEMAPYAVTLTRMSDGLIIDVNREFETFTGYHRAEVIGKSTIDLPLWERDEDRTGNADTLVRDGRVRGREASFRKKSGSLVTGLLSADVIVADGERNILTSILDITERKQTAASLLESEARRNVEMAAALETQRQGRIAAQSLMDTAVAARADAEAATALLQQQADALHQRNEQLDRFNRLAVNRELDMISLKRQVNALSLQLGQAAPFDLAFADVPQDPVNAANEPDSSATGAPR